MPEFTQYDTREILTIDQPISEITWSIDRTPDLNFINNDTYNYNNYTLYNQHLYDIISNDEPTIHFEELNININIVCESIEISNDEQNCCICLEIREKDKICLLNCNHKFCGICVESCIKKNEKYNCSLCRESVTCIKTQNIEIFKNLTSHCL